VCSEKMEEFTYHALKVEGKQGAVVCPRIGRHERKFSIIYMN